VRAIIASRVDSSRFDRTGHRADANKGSSGSRKLFFWHVSRILLHPYDRIEYRTVAISFAALFAFLRGAAAVYRAALVMLMGKQHG